MDKLISLTKPKTAKRARVILVALFIFGAFLVVNIFRLDFFLYAQYKQKTLDQITTTSALRAERGKIYDSNMQLLADTRTSWRIFVSTREIKKFKSRDGVEYDRIIARGCAEILGLSEETVYRKITNTATLDVTIKKDASEEEYQKILEFTEKNRLSELLLTEAQSSRYYPEGTLAAHVLGFTGSDGQGLYGLEYSYNEILTGTDGYYMYAKDAGGNSLPNQYADYVAATDGASIVTTIDSFVQQALEGELERIRINHDVSNRVTGIVMDTETGAILAMATSSPFDPNDPFVLDSVSEEKLLASGYAEGSEEYKAYKNSLMQIMWSNKAVSEAYEPGSTFKIITVAAALDAGAASINDRFSCTGHLSVGGWRIKCHKTNGHGSGFTLAYGLQMSCNPTMMTLASRLGSDKFYEYVASFGYFEKSGIDLPSEGKTVFHEKDALGATELATASFGQRFKVTVISHLTAIAAVANGGKLVTPYVVDKIISPSGEVISQHEVEIRGEVISEEVASIIAEVLEEGVSGEGGAKNAYVEGYKVAAKTGTSEKFDVLDENGRSYLRIGSTVAFAPVSEGGIAVIIVVDEPQCQVKYGSQVAAPYISSLLSTVLPYLEYESDNEPQTEALKSYVGLSAKDAAGALKELGISYQIIGDGERVLMQAPSEGVVIAKGASTVYLYTEIRDGDTVSVPSLIGLSLAQANKLAINCGLNLSVRGGVREGAEEIYKVTAQDISPAAEVKRGSVILIYVAAEGHND
ncbi:MAG: hypothetical protein IKL79_03930 [Clostridia bacterium]|nr:hypothetical protein [Clostridia bacterium]